MGNGRKEGRKESSWKDFCVFAAFDIKVVSCELHSSIHSFLHSYLASTHSFHLPPNLALRHLRRPSITTSPLHPAPAQKQTDSSPPPPSQPAPPAQPTPRPRSQAVPAYPHSPRSQRSGDCYWSADRLRSPWPESQCGCIRRCRSGWLVDGWVRVSERCGGCSIYGFNAKVA